MLDEEVFSLRLKTDSDSDSQGKLLQHLGAGTEKGLMNVFGDGGLTQVVFVALSILEL